MDPVIQEIHAILSCLSIYLKLLIEQFVKAQILSVSVSLLASLGNQCKHVCAQLCRSIR